MHEVKLSLVNIQSHKNTSIVLKPGLTLLVAKDNNVGKSTVFRALDLIAQIHNSKPEDIIPLLRYGTEEGIISCEFDNQRVELHIFLMNSTIRYYFLHNKNNTITHLDRAPTELIHALNLIAPTDIKQTINMVEADKYQIVIEEGSVNDSIISFLFTDQMVEHIKENAAEFANILSGDNKFYSSNISREQKKLETLKYRPYVKEFDDTKEFLTKICTLIDKIPNYDGLRKLNLTSINTSLNEKQNELVELLDSLLCHKKITALSKSEVDFLINICDLIIVLGRLIKTLHLNSGQKIALDKIYSVLRKFEYLDTLNNTLNNYIMYSNKLDKLLYEKSELTQQLSKILMTVNCPVKGKVFYNEKGCISTDD